MTPKQIKAVHSMLDYAISTGALFSINIHAENTIQLQALLEEGMTISSEPPTTELEGSMTWTRFEPMGSIFPCIVIFHPDPRGMEPF